MIRDNLEEFTLADGRRILVVAEGRLVNLGADEGHPADVMDMSFSNQAMAAEYLIENQETWSQGSIRCPRRSTMRWAAIIAQAARRWSGDLDRRSGCLLERVAGRNLTALGIRRSGGRKPETDVFSVCDRKYAATVICHSCHRATPGILCARCRLEMRPGLSCCLARNPFEFRLSSTPVLHASWSTISNIGGSPGMQIWWRGFWRHKFLRCRWSRSQGAQSPCPIWGRSGTVR